MKKVIFNMEPIGCPSCVQQIEKVLSNQNGVKKIKVKFFSNKAVIDFDETENTPDQLEQVLVKLGYPVLDSKVS